MLSKVFSLFCFLLGWWCGFLFVLFLALGFILQKTEGDVSWLEVCF